MPRTPAQRVLDSVIRDALVPVLKEDGYRRSAHTFRRHNGSRTQVVNVHASAWGTATDLSFTLNLGVFFPEVERFETDAQRESINSAGPQEWQCHARTRIGSLMPHGRDTWWDVRLGSDVGAVVANVRAAFIWHGRPWLESMLDLHEAYRVVGQSNVLTPWSQAAFALAAGDRDTARAILARAYKRVKNARASILEFAGQRGLLPL